MYVLAPEMMAALTPVDAIKTLGVEVLRIEAFAEPFFAASIVTYSVCVGAGDTLRPAAINLCSMWLVRLSLAWWLSQSMGLKGVWIAMATEPDRQRTAVPAEASPRQLDERVQRQQGHWQRIKNNFFYAATQIQRMITEIFLSICRHTWLTSEVLPHRRGEMSIVFIPPLKLSSSSFVSFSLPIKLSSETALP